MVTGMTKATNTPSKPTSARPTPEPFRTVDQVATQLAVDVATIRRWIHDGQLRAIKLPKGYRIDPADLAHFLGDRVVVHPQARP